MLELIYSILDRLDRVQHGATFRVIAGVIGLLIVGVAAFLAATGRAEFMPEAFRENLISSTAVAVMVIVGIVWLQRTLTALALLGPGVIVSLVLAGLDEPSWGRMVLGVSGLGVLFVLALQLVRALFDLPWRPLAVARLVLDEAVRMQLALIFIVAILVLIPLLAATLDPGEALRYRIQTFLSYGTGVSYSLLALMTLFLSTATVAFEQRSKTIFQIVSKPVSRFEYLLGKWLGVMGLNAILLVIVAGSVFWFVQYMRTLPALDPYDALAVDEQVLTARVGVRPTLPDLNAQADQRARELIAESPELEADTQTLYSIGQQVLDELRTRELTVDPGEGKEYRFENVRPISRTVRRTVSPGDVIDLGQPVKTVFDIRVQDETGDITYAPGRQYEPMYIGTPQNAALRFVTPNDPNAQEFNIRENQTVSIRYYPANAITLRFKLNSGDNDPGVSFPITIGVPQIGYYEVRQVALVQTQTLLIPAGAVDEDGTLTIDVINADVNTRTAYFEAFNFPPDGLEVMYKVSNFEPNYLRAMLIIWIKLGFLSMLGIAAATFAGFPVACLLAFGVFFGAQIGPFLTESLEFYRVTDLETKQILWGKWIISKIAMGVSLLLKGYGEIRPTERLIEGRAIPWMEVAQAIWLIFGVWTGLSFLVGWFTFQRRQLAIYSGHS